MKQKLFIRQPGNYDLQEAQDADAHKEWAPSLTQQSQLEDSDINVIWKRFQSGAPLPQNIRTPTYGDFTEITDFRSAYAAIQAATASFLQLPADVRLRFHNDASLFVDYCSDPQNAQQLKAWGMLPPDPQASPPGGPPMENGPNVTRGAPGATDAPQPGGTAPPGGPSPKPPGPNQAT